jgi:hypothetical protein
MTEKSSRLRSSPPRATPPPQDHDQWIPNQSFLFHKRLVEGGLERITQAVDTNDKRRRIYSNHVNCNQLLLDLLGAHEQWILRSELDSTQTTKKKTALIQSIAKTAIVLRSQLLERGELPDNVGVEYYTYAARMIAARFMPEDGFKPFLAGLNQIIACAETCADPRYVGFRSPRGLTKTFLSEILPRVYEQNFNRKHGFSQTGGPYVRFAVATMKEMGKKISEGTVIAAIREARSGKGTGYRKKNIR